MNNDDFNELAGRIQGLGDFVLYLTAELEMKQLIDGDRLNKAVQDFAENRYFESDHLQATKRTLDELAQFLHDARMRRLALQRRRGSRKYHS